MVVDQFAPVLRKPYIWVVGQSRLQFPLLALDQISFGKLSQDAASCVLGASIL